MSSEWGFSGFLALTLVLLGLVVWSGHAARRKVHLSCVALTLAALGVTIFFAERMGHHYDLKAAGAITPVHLFVAKLTTGFYLAPLFTGWKTLRDPRWRPRHRVLALVTLALTVCTAVTGTWMLFAAPRLG